jgi:hypothetical protein
MATFVGNKRLDSRLAKPVIAKPITKMINKTITNSVFPDQLKQAQVVALHKKNNALHKSNGQVH